MRLSSVSCCVLALAMAVLSTGAAAQPSGARGDDFLYRVMRNDTLEGLAARFTQGSSVWPQLQSINQVQDPHKLSIGRELRIPFSLIPELPDQARVSYMTGQAQAEGRALRLNDAVVEGQTVSTRVDSSLTLTLGDGSTVSVAPGSSLLLKRLRAFKGTGIVDLIVQLEAGTMESQVDPKKEGVGRFEVRTPITITGVRGTNLRVHKTGTSVFNEVVEGQAAVDGAGATENTLRARQGIAINQAGQSSGVRQLLAAPDLPRPVRGAGGWALSFPAVPGAQSYRVRVTADPQGAQLVSSRQFAEPAIAFSAPRPGTYYVFVRAVDDQGLGGLDARQEFEGSGALLSSDGVPVLSGFGQIVGLQQF